MVGGGDGGGAVVDGGGDACQGFDRGAGGG